MFEFRCGYCGTSYDVDDRMVGQQFTCQKCGKSGEIPPPRPPEKPRAPKVAEVVVTGVEISVGGWASIFIHMVIGAIPAVILLLVLYVLSLVLLAYMFQTPP